MRKEKIMKKTIWLLDLDGVVNCTKPKWSETPRRVHVTTLPEFTHIAQTWRIRWSPTLLLRILAINALPHVEVQWCSTWCQLDANGVPEIRRVERALRLPEMPCAFTHSAVNQTRMHSFKRMAALAVLEAGHRLIWTDDEVVPEDGDPFLDQLYEMDGEMLLIKPKWRDGLTRENMDQIEEWTLLD